MSPLCWEIVAALSFLGTHFLLSHPLRAPLVRAAGEAGFAVIYSLVAFATLGWLVFAFRAVPAEAPLWAVGGGLWIVGTVLTYFASMLFVGSLFGNPALPGPPRSAVPEPRGVFSVTRHPMMWSFALWGISHILVFPTPSNIVLAGSIVVLALVGAAFQDAKKRQLRPEMWPALGSENQLRPARRGACRARQVHARRNRPYPRRDRSMARRDMGAPAARRVRRGRVVLAIV